MSSEHHHHHHGEQEGVELPTPTAWPITAALGITLIALGLVTSIVVSIVGLVVTLSGAVGWFLDVFPSPQHEIVPYADPEKQAAPVKVSQSTINHLRMGQGGHRAFYPIRVHRYTSGVLGGLAGGAAMAVVAMIYGIASGHTLWFPVNLMAAAGLPGLMGANIATLDQFHLGALLVALMTHTLVSILVGWLYAVLLPMLPARFEWFWGGIVTPLLWTAVIVPMFQVVDPDLAKRVDWIWFVLCQITFGVVGGFVVYKSQKVETMQTWSLAARMGIHAMENDKSE
jgi:hypothetical protein